MVMVVLVDPLRVQPRRARALDAVAAAKDLARAQEPEQREARLGYPTAGGPHPPSTELQPFLLVLFCFFGARGAR